ncbi:hypothetical protein VTH06DRAFT_1669 [Thermothelomyces fergusii]
MQYRLLSELGSGCFGAVYKVRDKNSGRLYAVKILVPSDDPWDRTMTMARRGEGVILPKLNHPHIVRTFGSEGWGTPHVEIALNLMDGNLTTLARTMAHRRCLLAKQVLGQMLQALDYLAARGYVHRDVKPDNIFFAAAPGQGAGSRLPFHFRLGDFGLCEHESRIDAGAVHGTTVFLAPELFPSGDEGGRRRRRRRLRWQRQSHKSDVWALYVTALWVLDLNAIWAMASRGGGERDMAIFVHNLAKRVDVDHRVGALRQMAETDPRKRASAGEMLKSLDWARVHELE